MAKAEKYITDLNETKWKGKPRDWYFGKRRVRRGYYRGKLVYNNALYELEIPDIVEVEAPGGNDAINLIHQSIVSKKTDVDGKSTDQTYLITPSDLTIPPNTTTEPIFGTFTVTQERSGLSVLGQYKLNPPTSEQISFSNLVITNVYYDYNNSIDEFIPAGGGNATLVVEYSALKTITNEVSSTTEPINGIATNINIETSSSNNYSHVTFYSNGDVYAESLYDSTYSSTFELVRIKKLNISVDFVNEKTLVITTLSATWLSSSTNNDIICYQQYNVPGDPISLGRAFTVDNGYVDEPGGTIGIDVVSYNRVYYVYTSTYQTSEQHIAIGGRVTDKGGLTISPEVWTTKSQELSVTVERNFSSSDRYFYIKISNGYEEKTATITQSGSSATIVSYVYKNIRKEGSLGTDVISARGGTNYAVDVEVALKCDRYAIWSDGRETIDTYNYGFTSSATSVTGTTVSGTGGATTGGQVYANSRGTNLDYDERHVFTIKTVTVYVNNSYITFDGYSHKVWQAENVIISTSGPTAVLDCSENSLSYDARGGSDYVTIYSYYETVYTYSSREKDYEYESISTSISTSNSNIAYPSSYSTSSDSERIRIYVSANTSTSSTKSATITIKQTGTGKSVSVSISVGKNYYTNTCTGYLLYDVYPSSSSDIPASGGSVSIKVKYRNTCGDVSYADGSWKNETYDDKVYNATSLNSDSSAIGTASGGTISVDSRTNITGSRRLIYNLTGGYTSEQGYFSCSLKIYQLENRLNTGAEQYVFSLYGSTDRDYEASAANDWIEFDSYTEQVRSYTSGYPIDDIITYRSCTASIVSGSSFISLNTTSSSSLFKVTIDANTTTSSRTAKVRVTNWKGNTYDINYTQQKDTVTTTLQSVTFKSVVFDASYTGTNVPASGGSATISVLLNKRYVIASAATGTSYNDIEVAANSVTITGSGSASVSGDTITISSLYDNTTNALTTVYTISKVGWSYKDENNKTWSNTTSYSKTLQLEINSISYGNWTYALSASTSKTSYTAAAANPSISVTSTRYRTYTYTSGYRDPSGNTLTENYGWKASVTSGSGSVTPTNASAGTTRADVTLTANTSTTSSKSTTVKIENAYDSTKYKTFTFTQTADKVASSTTVVTVDKVTAPQAAASGNTINITMTLKSVATTIYESGREVAGTATYPTATVSSISGSVQNSSGAYISGTGVVVKNAGTIRHDSVWTVFKVTSVSGTYNSKTYSWSGTLNIQQAANTPKTTYQAYQVTGSTSTTSISSTGGSFSVSSTCVRPYTITWTSGAPGGSGSDGATATVSGTNCTVSPTSFNTSGTITATVSENTSAARTCSVKITSPTTSVYKTVSVTQNQVALVITPTLSSVLVAASGGSVSIIYTSTRNGSAYKPTSITSNQSWASVVSTSQSGSTYTTTVSVASHTNTSSRSATITLTSTSGTVTTTKTVTITQSGYVAPKPTRIAKFNGIFQFGVKLNLSGPSTIDYTKVGMYGPTGGTTRAYLSAPSDDPNYTYTGGSDITLRFVVSSSTSESGKISESSLTGISVTKDSTTTLRLTNLTSTSAAKYVLVYLNGTLYETCMIAVPPV